MVKVTVNDVPVKFTEVTVPIAPLLNATELLVVENPAPFMIKLPAKFIGIFVVFCVTMGDTVMGVWVEDVKPLDAKVRVYAVPAVPLMPTLVKVAIPATALTVVVPTVVAPELTVMVTEAVLLVTMLPAASLMVMMG